MVYDIDIHELNLGPFRNLKFFDEISLKKCVFFAFLNNKCIIIYFFRKKTTTISKRRRF
jgi:phage-related protein